MEHGRTEKYLKESMCPKRDMDKMIRELYNNLLKEFSKYIVKNGGVFECLLSGGEPLLLGDKLFEIMNILHNDGRYFL